MQTDGRTLVETIPPGVGYACRVDGPPLRDGATGSTLCWLNESRDRLSNSVRPFVSCMTEMSQRHVQGREWTHEHDEWNLTLSDGQLVSRGSLRERRADREEFTV